MGTATRRARYLTAAALLLPLLAACGQASTSGPGPTDPAPTDPALTEPVPADSAPADSAPADSAATDPEPVLVTVTGTGPDGSSEAASSTTLELTAWSACNAQGCYDSAPPAHAPAIGSPETVTLTHPGDLQEVSATFRAPTDCGERATDTDLTRNADGSWTLHPAGGRGEWTVDLWGRSDAGSFAASFAWHTPQEGPVRDPLGALSLLVDHDGELDSYGTELVVLGLAHSPEHVSADITVTDPDGGVTTWPVAAPQHPEPQDRAQCSGRVGELFLTGQDTSALAALGTDVAGPFRYDVALTLDGSTYHGTATWPQDAGAQGLATELVWSPALPAWDGTHP